MRTKIAPVRVYCIRSTGATFCNQKPDHGRPKVQLVAGSQPCSRGSCSSTYVNTEAHRRAMMLVKASQ